jgi:hypothetical protein
MVAELEIGGSWGVAFLVSAGIMAEIIAKACSSPQTLEINAQARADTLVKWVSVGIIEGIALVLLAAFFDKKYRVPILLGGILEAIITWIEYAHAKSSGLSNGGPATEIYT